MNQIDAPNAPNALGVKKLCNLCTSVPHYSSAEGGLSFSLSFGKGKKQQQNPVNPVNPACPVKSAFLFNWGLMGASYST